MKRSKIIIFILAMCIWSYLQIAGTPNADLLNVYNGIIFNSTFGYYVGLFFIYACYCFYTYNEFETYMKQYAVILVTREKSRNQLWTHLDIKLFKFIIQIEGMKIACYGLVMLFLKNGITVSSPMEFIRSILINVLVYFLLLYIQMIIEICSSGSTAVTISLIAFLIGVGISDFIDRVDFIPDELNVCIVQNLTMRIRAEALLDNEELLLVSCGLLVLLIGIDWLMRLVFKKKDIL